MSELRFDVKQLLKDWNDCPEDDGFTDDHPILLMAMDVDDMRRIIREKEARIARLEQAIKEMAEPEYYETEYDGQMLSVCNLCGSLEDIGHEPDCGEEYKELLNESPQQSLAHIQADAVEQAVKLYKLKVLDGPDVYSDGLLEYAQQLRDKADKEQE